MSEVCTYNGTEIPAKEVECIIIYDDETGVRPFLSWPPPDLIFFFFFSRF